MCDKYKEALKTYCHGCDCFSMSKDCCELKEKCNGYKILKELIDKETPKKVLLEADGYADGALVYDIAGCPNCGKGFEIEYDEHSKYCPDCGQRLDWSDVDD